MLGEDINVNTDGVKRNNVGCNDGKYRTFFTVLQQVCIDEIMNDS